MKMTMIEPQSATRHAIDALSAENRELRTQLEQSRRALLRVHELSRGQVVLMSRLHPEIDVTELLRLFDLLQFQPPESARYRGPENVDAIALAEVRRE